MKRKSVFLAIGLLLFLVACQAQDEQLTDNLPQEEELPPPPAAPVEEAEPEQEDDSDAQAVESGLDKAFGPVKEDEVITLDDVICDADTRTVTFRFRNPDDVSWQLNQEVPFPAPADLKSVRVTLNGYELNGRAEYRDPDGNLLFGEGKFSTKCDDVEVLAPGESVTCTVSPVPLKSSTGVAAGVNEIVINSVGSDGNARFTCE